MHVDHGEDAGSQGDAVAAQAVGVTRAVPALVVAQGDIQGGAQVLDRGEQFVAQAGMAFGDLPFTRIQAAGLVEDVLGDDQLADVVQQGAAAQVVELPFVHVEFAGELDGPVRHALGVGLGLAPGGLEGARPALDGGVVRQGQLHVGALQVAEERGAVDGHAGGAGQGGEELEPVVGGLQQRCGGRSRAPPPPVPW